ncbi:hypothetical protein ACFX1T_032429 [Malus domestica]
MTQAVADFIGGLVGCVQKVDKSGRSKKEGKWLATGRRMRSGFQGLDAITDLRGNPLGNGPRRRASIDSSGGGRSSEGGLEDRCVETDGGRRSGRSSTTSGMGGHS